MLSLPDDLFQQNPRPQAIARHCRVLAAVLAMFAASGTARAAPALLPGYFLGQASAVEAIAGVGPLTLDVGNAANASCPCRGTNGHKAISSVSTLNVGVGGNLLTGTVNTSTAYGLKTATTATTEQTSHVTKINLLGGLITADDIKADATVTATASTLDPSFTGSRLVNLVVAGQKIDANVKANTVIPLPGIGSVTVKFVNSAIYGTEAAGIEVEMLRVQVTESNNLGLNVGAELIVAEAYAGYDRTQPKATIGGYAETLAVTANAGALLQEAATAGAIAGIPSCLGTGGKTASNTVANLAATGLLAVNTATSTAFGGPAGHAIMAKTTASVGQISLLGGLITADSIAAVAAETRQHGVSTASSLGSTFGQLYVANVLIATNVAPNTVISLAGLGYVVLNEQPPVVDDHIQVNGLHIVVTASNSLNLPIGAQIFVAHAEATASKF